MRSSLLAGLMIVIALAVISMLLLPFWVAGIVLVLGFIALVAVSVTARGAAETAHPRSSIDPASSMAAETTRSNSEHDADIVADSSH